MLVNLERARTKDQGTTQHLDQLVIEYQDEMLLVG